MTGPRDKLSPRANTPYTPFSIFSRLSELADPLSNTSHTTQGSVKTLSQTVKGNRRRYLRPTEIKIKIGTWNVGANPGTETELHRWLHQKVGSSRESNTGLQSPRDTSESILQAVGQSKEEDATSKQTVLDDDKLHDPSGCYFDLLVLGLQEVVPLNSAAAAMLSYAPQAIDFQWRDAAVRSLPSEIRLISEMQLGGMALMVFATPDMVARIGAVHTQFLGTAAFGLGLKGAVAIRLIVGESTKLIFINSHLAAGDDINSSSHRNSDVDSINSRLKFPQPELDGVVEDFEDQIRDADFAWWFGDLNYRMEGISGDEIRRRLEPHMVSIERAGTESAVPHPTSEQDPRRHPTSDRFQFPHHGLSGSVDNCRSHPGVPETLQSTIDQLLNHDQLRAQQNAKKAFHDGWREGAIRFLPTYKYDIGTANVLDTSEKKRVPSWCDRVLYRSRSDLSRYERREKEHEDDRRFEETVKSQNPDDVLFDYHPGLDMTSMRMDPDDESLASPGASGRSPVDEEPQLLKLQAYESHQEIISSDHKPVTAIFTIEYPEVIPRLKEDVFNEVAKEFDRSENEARPAVTIVSDFPRADLPSSPNEGVGQGQTLNHTIDFGDVRFNQYVRRDLTIANTSKVISSISFSPRLYESSGRARVCKAWLKVNFVVPQDVSVSPNDKRKGSQDSDEIILDPGEAINVVLEVIVEDAGLLRSLNSEQEDLCDILVLHVTDGRDHFLTISGKWMPSCFGRTIKELASLPEGGVRAADDTKIVDPGHAVLSTLSSTPDMARRDRSQQEGAFSSTCAAPKELYRLVGSIEDMTERAIAEWEMKLTVFNEKPPWASDASWPFRSQHFQYQGDDAGHDLALAVRELMDNRSDPALAFGPDIHVALRLEILANTLLDFLASLRDGIIPHDLWSEMEVEHRKRVKAKLEPSDQEKRDFILEVLSKEPSHHICFVFLTAMLHRMVNELTHSFPSAPSPRSHMTSMFTKSNKSPITSHYDTKRRYAEMFAEVMIRPGVINEKRKREHRVETIGLFI